MLLTSVAGCSGLQQWKENEYKVGPNYRRPCAVTSASWIDSQSSDIVVASQESNEWWSVFNDPTLEQLIQTAYQQNLTLRAAGLRVLQARTQRDVSALNLLPQSQAMTGSYSRNQISRLGPNVFPGTHLSFDNWQTGFDMSWELDVWGRIRRSVEAADAALDAQVESYDAVLVTLIGDVAATYVELRALDERLNLAEKNASLQKSSLELASERNKEGKVSSLDVSQAKANYTDTLALIPSLRQARRLSVNRLAILLGMTPQDLEPMIRERGGMPLAPEQAVVGIPNELLRRRPDIRAVERQVAIQSARIGIAQAELYPHFGISGEIGVNSEQFRDLYSSGSQFGAIVPGFRWNILNYGRLIRGVEVEKLKFEESVVNYQNAVLAAHQEVEDAIISFVEAKQRLEQLRQSASAVAESVETVRLQYKEGKADFGRVFVLESTLVQRQDELVSVEAEVSISLVKIYKGLGGGWQLRLGNTYTGSY
jgi:NodT family efflux transporter outer membrane factor (OMF) lipoprotein